MVLAVVVGSIVVLVTIAVVVTPRGVNPRVARLIEIFGWIALVTVYPLAAWVTGIFAVLRDLRIG